MKRFLWSALSIFMLLMLAESCGGKDPEPQPIPTPPTPPVEQHWLQLDAERQLLALPIPYISFGENTSKVKEWEKIYASELIQEKDDCLLFKTVVDNDLNPSRAYLFKDGGLEQSSYRLSPELVYDNKETYPLKKSFLALLDAAGYKWVESDGKQFDTENVFTNGTIDIVIINEAKNMSVSLLRAARANSNLYAEILFKRHQKQTPPSPPEKKFRTEVKDFPYMNEKAWVKDYQEADITAHEKTLGRTLKEDANNVDFLEYMAPSSEEKTNFQIMIYERKNSVDDKGNETRAVIKAVSTTLKDIKEIDNPDIKAYIEKQGFFFEKEIQIGNQIAKVYNNTQTFFKLYVAQLEGERTAWVFTQYKIKEDDPSPEPEKKREAFYLPIFDWGAPISPDSPIIKEEQKRNFTCEFKDADPESQNFPRPKRLESAPPYDKEYGYEKKKAGILGFTYQRDKYEGSGEDVLEIINILFNSKFTEDKRRADDPELKQYLESVGFELKRSGSDSGFFIVDYYNASQKVILTLSTMNSFTSGFFKPMEKWDEEAVYKLHRNYILYKK